MSNVTPAPVGINSVQPNKEMNETELKQFEAFASKLDVDFKKQSPNKTFDLLETSLKNEEIKTDIKVRKLTHQSTKSVDKFVSHYLSNKSNYCTIDHHKDKY